MAFFDRELKAMCLTWLDDKSTFGFCASAMPVYGGE